MIAAHTIRIGSPAILGSFGRVFCALSKEARTRGFASLAFAQICLYHRSNFEALAILVNSELYLPEVSAQDSNHPLRQRRSSFHRKFRFRPAPALCTTPHTIPCRGAGNGQEPTFAPIVTEARTVTWRTSRSAIQPHLESRLASTPPRSARPGRAATDRIPPPTRRSSSSPRGGCRHRVCR